MKEDPRFYVHVLLCPTPSSCSNSCATSFLMEVLYAETELLPSVPLSKHFERG